VNQEMRVPHSDPISLEHPGKIKLEFRVSLMYDLVP